MEIGVGPQTSDLRRRTSAKSMEIGVGPQTSDLSEILSKIQGGADASSGHRLGSPLLCSGNFFRPLGAWFISACEPTACAVGCILSPLRGFWGVRELREKQQVPPLRRRWRSGSGRDDRVCSGVYFNSPRLAKNARHGAPRDGYGCISGATEVVPFPVLWGYYAAPSTRFTCSGQALRAALPRLRTLPCRIPHVSQKRRDVGHPCRFFRERGRPRHIIPEMERVANLYELGIDFLL